MSALVCNKGKNGAIFHSDGVSYDNDGLIVGFGTKVVTLAANSAAFGWVGIGGFGSILMNRATLIGSFDDLLAEVVPICQDIHAWFEMNYTEWCPHVSAVLVGWSEQRQAFEGYTFGSRDKEVRVEGKITERKSWTLTPFSGIWTSSIPKADDCARVGLPLDLDIDDSDELAVKLICGNRLQSGRQETHTDFEMDWYQVGGFIQRSTLFRTDYQECDFAQTIVHRWPDEVGGHVDPNAGDLLPRYLGGGRRARGFNGA